MTRGSAPIRAISFDFGNTLVPVGRDDLRAVVRSMTSHVASRSGPFDEHEFGSAWAAERERQFAQDVPRMREVDLAQRFVRVLARMRGMAAPGRAASWDDGAAARLSTPEEVEAALADYSRAFVATIRAPAEVGPLLERLAAQFVLGICSNWPLAATIDGFAEHAGWMPHLRAVVVSQRVGAIKPDPRMFDAAEEALGTAPGSILHVGDDWAADVVGAKRAGWRAAYLAGGPADSPLPASAPAGDAEPDFLLDRLIDLEDALARAGIAPRR
jgi:FMN hydrolase / 5-amino-6-(5-phospho-D-ribitylamino)uracil phosphatase